MHAGLIAFALASAVLIWLSRASLRRSGSNGLRPHGFYRFFAWEGILVLFLLNAGHWFRTPSAWYQLLSWSLLILSLPVLIFGFHTLASRGAASANGDDRPELYRFERTSQLVTTGIYRHIRHPLYCSLLLLAWGIAFKQPDGLNLLLGVVVTLLLYATARADEAECIRYFGDGYRDYMTRTKMFVPGLF